ncbi:alanine racemase [Wukongibacter baidiensis]|uniref:alanine racemase n=1 Tax=Wukongibacter baidiensis TaxID=1723361 RepID=UPI003D7F6D88
MAIFEKKVNGVWTEINLDNIAHNTREAKRLIKKGTILCGVLKADGYGHGAIQIGKTLLENGVERFAVANISEAIELRKANFDVPILILSYTPEYRANDIIKYDITQTVYNYNQAKFFSEAARELGTKAKLHIKVDTGMNRIGYVPCIESVKEIIKIMTLPNAEVEGIFTHFAQSFIEDKTPCHIQVEKFLWVINELERNGIHIPIKHVSNSAAVTDLPQYNFDMVRVGSTLFGLPHMDNIDKNRIDLMPAMTLKTVVSNVKMVPKGEGVSYGYTYITPNNRKIATLPLGYVDGLTRIGSGKSLGIIRGQKVCQVGIICMDQCMLDVTDIENVEIGDEVILLGTDGKNEITADDRAKILGTGNCEIVCAVGRRVPRVYKSNGRIVDVVNYLTNEWQK